MVSTCVLCSNLLSLVLVANFEVIELSEYKLKRKYIEKEKVNTSNINLQTRELQYNYSVYILSLKKEIYTEYGL